MRILYIMLASAVALTAQSPLTTTFANNNGGGLGGALYFDLECISANGITITDLDLNFSSQAGQAGSIDIYMKPNSWQPHTATEYELVASGTVTAAAGVGLPTNVVLDTPLQLGDGCKMGIAIVQTGLSSAYTTANTSSETYATAELELTVGGASNGPFIGTAFNPRLVNTNIYYTSGGACPNVQSMATVSTVGTGCGDGSFTAWASFYELAAAGPLDLAGKKLVGTNTGNGYEMTLETGTGISLPLGSTNLNLFDDEQLPVGSLGMVVSSDCWMALGSGPSTEFITPTVEQFLVSPATGVFSWTDLEPDAAGSGSVYYHEDAGVATASYMGVFGKDTTDQNYVQIKFDTNNNNWSIEWEAVPGGPEPWLVGFTPAGSSADGGATDISTLEGVASIYDLQAPGALDLAGQKLTATRSGNGYSLSIAGGTGISVPTGALNLNMDDDEVQSVGTLGMYVGSNGWMAMGPGNDPTFAVDPLTMLNNPSTAVYSWTDLEPNDPGSGGIYYSEANGIATATFDGVYGWGAGFAPNPSLLKNYFQIQINTNTGDWSIEWGLVPGDADDWLVGYSYGGSTIDPDATDISASFALLPTLIDPALTSASDAGTPGLSLISVNRPVQGMLNSNFEVTTNGIPSTALSHLGLIGLSNPNLDLSLIGVPGCFSYSSSDVIVLSILPPSTSSLTWNALTIPPGPVFFNGFKFHLQATIFGTPENSFFNLGALTSNGLECTIGNF